jgi:hypothetical protein
MPSFRLSCGILSTAAEESAIVFSTLFLTGTVPLRVSGIVLASGTRVVRSSLLRRLVSSVLVFGLLGTSLAAIAEASSEALCERPHHDCATTVLTACCCQPQPASTTALSVFAETWTSISKLYWNSATWTADLVAPEHTANAVVAVVRSEHGSPPIPPLRPAESLTVLRI